MVAESSVSETLVSFTKLINEIAGSDVRQIVRSAFEATNWEPVEAKASLETLYDQEKHEFVEEDKIGSVLLNVVNNAWALQNELLGVKSWVEVSSPSLDEFYTTWVGTSARMAHENAEAVCANHCLLFTMVFDALTSTFLQLVDLEALPAPEDLLEVGDSESESESDSENEGESGSETSGSEQTLEEHSDNIQEKNVEDHRPEVHFEQEQRKHVPRRRRNKQLDDHGDVPVEHEVESHDTNNPPLTQEEVPVEQAPTEQHDINNPPPTQEEVSVKHSSTEQNDTEKDNMLELMAKRMQQQEEIIKKLGKKLKSVHRRQKTQRDEDEDLWSATDVGN